VLIKKQREEQEMQVALKAAADKAKE